LAVKTYTAWTPWAYRKGNSPLHRLPGGVKLAGLLGLSLGAFFPGLVALPVLALLLAVLSLAGGMRPWELLRGSRPLLLFVVAIFLFQALELNLQAEAGAGVETGAEPPHLLSVNPEGLKEGLVFALRIAFSFAAGALFFALTTLGEIKKSLARLESFFHLEDLRISLLISLMLMFLPRFFEQWEEAERAWRSRGGGRGFRKLRVLMPLVIAKMLTLAAETSRALESRGV
jgi:energy-coupling factor transporter transmembrane protein EcfT